MRFSYTSEEETIRSRDTGELTSMVQTGDKYAGFALRESDDSEKKGVVEWLRHTIKINNEPQRRKIAILVRGE